MARRAKTAEIENRVSLPDKPRRNHPDAEMIPVGGAHLIHAVGPLASTGARSSYCGIVGSFYDPPPGPEFPRCPACFEAVRR